MVQGLSCKEKPFLFTIPFIVSLSIAVLVLIFPTGFPTHANFKDFSPQPRVDKETPPEEGSYSRGPG